MKRNKEIVGIIFIKKIRNEGYTIVAKKRTIYIPYTQQDYTIKVCELRDRFGYAIQSEIV